jgi:hypothetical protein
MMHFSKGGYWQDGVGVDFLGKVKYKEQQNQPLMEEDVDGLSDRQIEIILGRTGWTGNNLIFLEPEVHCVKEGLWIW